MTDVRTIIGPSCAVQFWKESEK